MKITALMYNYDTKQMERFPFEIEGDEELPRGRQWQRTVKTTNGKWKITLKGIACSISGCICDAKVVKVVQL